MSDYLICYLCGAPMIDRPDVQEQTQIPTVDIKYKHVENIIKNALHGKIKSDSILCADCGNKLCKEFDADFVSLFDHFTSVVSVPT